MKVHGPVNYVYLKRKSDNKHIIIFYDVHDTENNQKCTESSIDIVEFIKKHLAPHFTSKNKLDIFVEQPLFYKENEEYTEPSSLDKMRRLLNKCPENMRCHHADVRKYIGFDIYFNLKNLYTDMIEHFRINRMTDLFNVKLFNSFIPNYINLLESCLQQISYMYLTDKTFHKDLLQSSLFSKQYKKISKDDQYKYLAINKKLKQEIKNYFNLHDKFIGELNECLEKSKNTIRHIDKCIQQNNIDIYKMLDDFYIYEIIPEIKDLNMSLELLISIISKTSDIYTIGRLLKPYVKTAVVYMGAEHGRNISKFLVDTFDFEIINSYKDQGYPSWKTFEKIYGNTKDIYCIDISMDKLQFY